MDNAIEIINVSKCFLASRPVLSHLSLEVKAGECFAVLGPNGAGKTTLLRILASLILPDEGQINIAGYDLKSQEQLVKSKIGLVTGEERSFYWRLTGRQNLEFFAAFYNLPPSLAKKRIVQLAERLGIAAFLNQRIKEYSTGIKQKAAIIRSLLSDPPILLIDEPTKSLDPMATQDLREFLKALSVKQGKTIFFSTHQISEAEFLADRLAILDKGCIKACGTVSALCGHSTSLYEIFTRSTTDRDTAEERCRLGN